MAKSVLSALLLFLLSPAHAVICKEVDEHGVVSYSDLPSGECAQPVTLPDYSRYAPRPISSPPVPSTSPPPSSAESGRGEIDQNYAEMRIEQPAEGASIWNNEGKVPVAIFLDPALQPGHKVQFLLDGQPAGPPVGSVGATLTNVHRGTHRLSARLLDVSGNVLREVGPVSFTSHRISVNRPGTSSPGEGDGGGQKGSTSYAPIPATPGKTNPAFAPSYTPGN